MDIRVIEFLTSRICHDLISPIGAVHNGVEFLQEMGPAPGEGGDDNGTGDAIALIGHSSSQASARLQLFRMVYGAGVKTTALELSDIHETMESYIKGDSKVTQSWSPSADLTGGAVSSGFCKMLLAVLLIAYESLPKGGAIDVRSDEDGTTILVDAQGVDAHPREGIDQGLAGNLDLDDIDPRLVHSYVTYLMGQAYGYRISVHNMDEGQVTYSLRAL